MPKTIAALLTMSLLASLAWCSGCSTLRRWRQEAGAEPDQPKTPAPLSLTEAQAILHGKARGMLVAANGGLAGQAAPANSLRAVEDAIDRGLPMVVVDVTQTPQGLCVLGTTPPATRPAPSRQQWTGAGHDQPPESAPPSASSSSPVLRSALEITRDRILIGLRLHDVVLSSIVPVIDEMKLTDQVLLLTSDSRQIKEAKPYLQRDPPIMLGVRALTADRLAQIESTPPWPTMIELGPQTLSPSSIARVHAMGARVLVHQRGVLLVRVGSDLMPYFRMGVAVILTDWPRQLLREMRQINEQPQADANASREGT
ncbi:MAG: hypothetical protein JXQ73_07295 [Phycisphaerae bacterium]|nr:hypothetical protein [Phycisphaerae bacterium]